MTDDKKDEEIIKLKKKIEELENKPKNKFKKIYFFSVSTIILLLLKKNTKVQLIQMNIHHGEQIIHIYPIVELQ